MRNPQEDSNLLKSLTAICREANSTTLGHHGMQFLHALRSDDPEIRTKAAHKLHAWADETKETLVRDERFPGKGTRMLRSNNGAAGFYPDFICTPLILRALTAGSANDAIMWLLDVMSATAAAGMEAQALWGVPVTEEIQLTPEIRIVPIGQLARTELGRIYRNHCVDERTPAVAALSFKQPDSALVVKYNIEPLILSEDSHQETDNSEYLQKNELFKEVGLALGICGPRAVNTSCKVVCFR